MRGRARGFLVGQGGARMVPAQAWSGSFTQPLPPFSPGLEATSSLHSSKVSEKFPGSQKVSLGEPAFYSPVPRT